MMSVVGTFRTCREGLFAPKVTRQGHFVRNNENAELVELVRARLNDGTL